MEVELCFAYNELLCEKTSLWWFVPLEGVDQSEGLSIMIKSSVFAFCTDEGSYKFHMNSESSGQVYCCACWSAPVLAICIMKPFSCSLSKIISIF